MASELATLIETLDLEQLDLNLFRGTSPDMGWKRVYGGQVVGQALVAATRTVEDERPVHSLHGYFIRPGDPSTPIIYDVARYRDGRSFTTRRVVAQQQGQPIFSMMASFHANEESLDHQDRMPDVPMPDALPSEKELVEKFRGQMPENMIRYFSRKRPIELRPTSPDRYLAAKKGQPAVHNIWFRAAEPLTDDDRLHRAVLAYASDMTLLDTTLVPHGRNLFDPDLMMASLDHAVWFHRPFRADDWLLYAQDSPSSYGARGLTRGSIFTPDGVLIASAAQEGLVRLRRSE